MAKNSRDTAGSLADRRAEAGSPRDAGGDDFAEEHQPSPTDPPNAPAEAPGGQEEGWEPPTRDG